MKRKEKSASAQKLQRKSHVKLKTKVWIALCVVLLIPTALLSFSLAWLATRREQSLRRDYGITDGADINLFSFYSGRVFDAQMETLQSDLREVLKEGAPLGDVTAYLKRKNSELGEQNAFLLASLGREWFYIAPGTVQEVQTFLEGQNPESGDVRYYLGGENQYLIGCCPVNRPEGENWKIYLVTNVSAVLPEARLTIFMGEGVIFTILIATVVLLLYWFYHSLVRPLRQLQRATCSIREGNLDFELEAEGDDEISDLCRSFEAMRRQLKSVADERLRNERENRELISNISHDLKTPITAIRGYVEGIMDGVASSPEKMERYIRTISNKANDMDRLIDELTLYSKLDTNRIMYNFTKIHVEDYFGDCAEELQLELEAKGIRLVYSNELQEDAMIIGDPEQLKKVINNIVSNSVKYMDKERGLIELRVSLSGGDFVRVELEDNGCGIAAKDLPYVFDRFYRTDASRNSQTGGSGIGLSIVKKIIEDHGGRIWAGGREGVGTVISFELRKYQEAEYEQNSDR